MTTMRISQLAARTGVPATTLRFYETAGLLTAGRTGAGYRVYDEDAVTRLAFIDAAKHLGLPLEEIAELLAVWETGVCVDVKTDLRPRLAARLAEAERRTTALAALTTTLQGALRHLDTLPDCDQPCGPECDFLAADQQADTTGTSERWRTAPIACTLDAAELDDRAARWRTVLAGAVRAPVADGIRLTLPAARLAAVAELAGAEQACCPFFDFRLHLDGADLHLEVRAPAEAAGMVSGLFDGGV